MANRTMKRVKTKTILLALCTALIASLAAADSQFGGANVYADSAAAPAAGGTGSAPDLTAQADVQLEPYFAEAMQQWEAGGAKPASRELKIPAQRFTRKSDDAAVRTGAYKGKNDVLLWSVGRGWVEYDIDVEEAGLYELVLDYHPFTVEDGGSRQPLTLTARINGELPFREARSMLFPREFKDAEPVKYDMAGNEIRSQIVEIAGWKTKAFADSSGAYAAPLRWNLRKGVNTIRIESTMQPAAIESITLKPPAMLPSYDQAKAAYPKTAGSKDGQTITIEAEKISKKNSSAIQDAYDRDPFTTPRSLKTISFNTLGGSRWTKGGQAVTWDIDVPEDGVYKLGLRANQNTRKNIAVFRTIAIDGKIPFQEMAAYKMPYAAGWQGLTIENEHGEPYGFYLTKGKHSLTMEATNAPYTPIVVQINQISAELRAIMLELRTVTGIISSASDTSNREDKYRVWDVDKDIPGLTDRLRTIRKQFADLAEQMKAINKYTDDVSQVFKNSAKEIETMLEKPNKIPYSQKRIGTIQESLESKRAVLTDSPLQLDKLYVAPVGQDFPRMKATFFQKMTGSIASLASSFTDRNKLAEKDGSELNVWMVWGRDYVDELQQLANEKFTPETGIRVKVNLIQSAEMLTLANAAGMMPDVALGVPGNMPFDMALRNAALNLSALPGADDIFAKYSPGTLLPFYYDGGYYGVPETIGFKVLFYRKDILRGLDLKVPNTWDDVYQMIPTLLQNQYNFYMEPADFSPIFFQNNVELYAKDGLKTGLDTPESFQAYKKWTDFYNVQGLDRVVQSFYNQFRRGEMPIGIADFNMYMQLLVAAPEIANDWGIAPVPGTKNTNGTIERWMGGSNPSNAMLFKSAKPEKQEQAWKFLQWYLSTETQTEYGLNLEQFHGDTFRWNTSNAEAFANMPWRPDDLNVILDQWRWIKEIPNVPGGYMTGRQIGFAWNQTVVDGVNYRIALENAIIEINRELARKQQEFHIIGEQGEVLKTLDLPFVTEPWKGVDKLVK
ncbi:extracellular solute-binding protein [Paenibacillus sp. MBLB4367]|uniref:extracellular solute-binding protein n=1 Tax=Paenibacillus sp. MBLB4367 TaxID=3384767 RepID=UPI003908369C